MGSEQEEDEMLMLPKAQLGSMLTSTTPDLTVIEMHSKISFRNSIFRLLYIRGICWDMEEVYADIWMMV